jgi:tripartite-type tricarboxylate transporter receptor subunit TctC
MENMAEITRRTLVAGSLALAAARQAQAADWPDKVITWVVPFPPGGPTDAFARPVGASVAQQLGESVLIDNRGGAGGTLGGAIAARAEPDGYTWLVASTGHTYASLIYPQAGFDLARDLTPVSAFARVPAVLVINPARIDARNLAEFIAAARMKPGEISIANAGLGTTTHLAGLLLEQRAGIQLNQVPYRGTGPALQDLLAGHVDATFGALNIVVPQVTAGKLRALGIAGRHGEALLPDVPTMNDAGLPDFRAAAWYALFAPRGTPERILDYMHAAVQRALALPNVKRVWEEQGAKVEPESRADFARFVSLEIERWSRIATAANIQLE